MPRLNISETRRKEIVWAFYRSALKKGIRSTSTRDIAAEANMKQGILYHYFKDRDEMVEQMVIKIAEEHVNSFIQSIDLKAPADEVFDKAIGFLFSEEMVSDNGSLFYDVWSEAKRNEKIARALEKVYQTFRKTVCQFLFDSGRASNLSYSEIDNLASMVIAMYEGVFLQWDFNRGEVNLDQMKTLTSAMVKAYLDSRQQPVLPPA